jgi:hypothetical protein
VIAFGRLVRKPADVDLKVLTALIDRFVKHMRAIYS